MVNIILSLHQISLLAREYNLRLIHSRICPQRRPIELVGSLFLADGYSVAGDVRVLVRIEFGAH